MINLILYQLYDHFNYIYQNLQQLLHIFSNKRNLIFGHIVKENFIMIRSL